MRKAVRLMLSRRCCQTWPQKRKTFGIESGPGYSMTCCPWTRKRHRCPPRRGHHHQAKRPLCSDLPNISGRLGAYDCENSKFTGPFQYVGKEGGVSTAWRNVPYADFDASRSSSKFGSSSTVQPESIRLIPCIKS